MADERTETPFLDAEAWLAAKGVRREPIRVEAPPAAQPPPAPSEGDRIPAAQREPRPAEEAAHPEALPEQAGASAGAPTGCADGDTAPTDGPPGDLGDEVSKAVAYALRATANTPMSEGRLRRRLGERGVPDAVIELAIERARSEGIVDDAALAAALVEEGRRKGHAPLRIRTDLQRRELPDELIERALAVIGDRDEEAVAFAVAQRRVQSLRGVDTETAFRRLSGFLSRRGYTDALSRKVARQVVFHDREPERTAER